MAKGRLEGPVNLGLDYSMIDIKNLFDRYGLETYSKTAMQDALNLMYLTGTTLTGQISGVLWVAEEAQRMESCLGNDQHVAK
jgi:hypothetical protein